MQRPYDEPVRAQRPQSFADRAPAEKKPAEPGAPGRSVYKGMVADKPSGDRVAADRNIADRAVNAVNNDRSTGDWINDDRILSDRESDRDRSDRERSERERTDRALYENGGFDMSPRVARTPTSDGGPGKEYTPVSGPSFLGLEPQRPEPARTYLYDDEPEPGHGRLYLGIILLLAVGGGLFWQWQHEGYPWNPPAIPATTVADTDSTEPPAPGSANATAPAEAPPESQAAAPDASKPPAAAASQPAPPTVEKTDDSADKPAEPVAKPATPTPRRASREPAPQMAAPDPSEALFVDGQKYLYGSGVPENCTLARAKLMAAANQSNSKAQSTVATMYATGHCLPRSLPSAYHWFALALHKERDNMRLQRDLEMLWNQMTPEEKQIALKSR
jgi:hypothetical protein